ncbi:DUF3800 domain-containing protein [Novosphingobium sp.]|uniref:DUF3800 domain-containing protein n=1 Tax=Novosphingobium sp. TaxID=1874826 RepID=UPI0025E56F1C|nr:DUF3800 domain-containing protein [Novosphingobium sp.]
MAVLKAYLDESGKDDDPGTPVVGVGGLVGSVEAWGSFEDNWQRQLDRWQIPYLHMKEIMDGGQGPFARFREDRDLMWQMLRDFVMAISSSELFRASHIVVKDHLKQFNAENKLCLNCYSLALYGCILEFSLHNIGEEIEIIVDKFDKSTQFIQMAKSYCQTDNYYKSELYWVRQATITPIGKDKSYKDVLPIQAADFVTWELRRSTNGILDFITKIKTGDDPQEWRRQEMQWSIEKHGRWPVERPSLFAIGANAPVENMIWDKRAMGIAHRARGGLW